MPAAMPLIRFLSRLVRPVTIDRRGATVVEYGLIISLIVLAIMGSLASFSRGSTSMWDNVSERVINAR